MIRKALGEAFARKQDNLKTGVKLNVCNLNNKSVILFSIYFVSDTIELHL